MSEGQVGNEGVTDWSTEGQSDKFYTTGRQNANGPNLRGVYCNYPKKKKNQMFLGVFEYHLFYLN